MTFSGARVAGSDVVGPLDESMAGNVLLPGENARIAPTTFDLWLAAGVR
jgi:hypothetical protein